MGKKRNRLRLEFTEEFDDRSSKRNKKQRSKTFYADKPQSDNDLRLRVNALNETQGQLLAQMVSNTITFGIGPAGTGKTMLSTCKACELLHDKKVDKIILTRPIIEIGRTIGHLPGDVNEKYEPYLAPFKQYFIDCFGKSGYEARLNKTIIPIPINFLQGHTWDDSIILLDEAQNMSVQEMFMFLTRIGKNSKAFITGDIKQTATTGLKSQNGLKHFLDNFVDKEIFLHGDIGVVEFTSEDVVRSDIVGRIIKFYDTIDLV